MPAIVIASFGTTDIESREASIGFIESRAREAFPNCDVRRAFTAEFVRKRIAKNEGINIPNVEEALTQLLEEGVEEVVLQPTHFTDGVEYRMAYDAAMAFADKFSKLAIGAPLLTSEEDYRRVVDAITADLDPKMDEGCCAIMVGHGGNPEVNKCYVRAQEAFCESGHDNYIVCTVEGEPDFEHAINAAVEGGYSGALLKIFMVVAGVHAKEDMAGPEDDSLASMMAAKGFKVQVEPGGLGQNAAIAQIYIDHLKKAMCWY